MIWYGLACFRDPAFDRVNDGGFMSDAGLRVKDLGTEEIRRGLEDGSMILIDVREPHEFESGHIPGARSMPLSSFDPNELPVSEGKRIVFSCRTGGRTLQALKLAQDAGIDLVEHYQPSFNGWVNDGGDVAYEG